MNPAISDNADRTSLGEPNVPQVYGISIPSQLFLSNPKSVKVIPYIPSFNKFLVAGPTTPRDAIRVVPLLSPLRSDLSLADKKILCLAI
jgi:hypothetical protein